MYIIVSNSDSSNYYTDNKANHFRVKLSKPLNLEGDWYVGLADIHLTENAENMGMLGFNADICSGLIADGVQTQLLRRFNCKRNVHVAFNTLYYVPVGKLFIDTMEFYITDADGKLASLSATVKLQVTLHFKPHNVSSICSRHLGLDKIL
jgi:hypothetical protein